MKVRNDFRNVRQYSIIKTVKENHEFSIIKVKLNFTILTDLKFS